MTTQHVPHTPLSPSPLWRRFLSLPHTRLGWWAVGLSAVGVALLFMINRFVGSEAVFRPMLFVFEPSWVASPASLVLAGLLAGAIVGLLALVRSQEERSVLVWLAMVPMALAPVLPIAFMAQGLRHEVRYDVSIVSTVLPLVGMTAGVAALHFAQRGKGRYGLGGTISSIASLIGVALIVVGALIGRASQNWLVGGFGLGVGLWVVTLGLAALAIVTLQAGVVPWWGGAALIVANPLVGPFISNLLFSFIPESHNAHDPVSKLARFYDLSASAEQWLSVAWSVAWGVGPWVVVGIAVLLAARRLTERPARVR